ncbi:nuclear transport factor 2 family protein [Flavobacterium sp. LAR06]|uniref:nuclear transport factor 2 family protein n=1 Tax=Flavobacterium sp. LAR06 TaxID=3064897 RepID=UPI0035C21FEE
MVVGIYSYYCERCQVLGMLIISVMYCFSESAIVFDEGKNYTSKKEIKNWIEKSSKEYNTVMKPIEFEGDAEKGSLKAEVFGTFPGSPVVLTYNLTFKGKHIESLKIN